MENPRPEKVVVVEEVRARLSSSSATLLTEYRGLKVAELADLRRSLRAVGGEYKIYKNTLVRLAVRELGLVELEELLTGPTAIAFVPSAPADGAPADAANVARALRDYARANPNLVVKGGVLGEKLLSADEARALADLPPREVLLARLAGSIAAPLQQFAGLLQALPRNLAYGLKALLDQRVEAEGVASPDDPAPDDPAPDDPAPDDPAPDDPAPDVPAPDVPAPDVPAPDVPASAPSEATETDTEE